MSDDDGLAGCFGGPFATGPGGEQELSPELLALWADPGIWSFALRRAGDPDLAQDALLHAVCAVARVNSGLGLPTLRADTCKK